MAKITMKVIGDAPFRGVAPGGTVRVSMKDSRTFASNLAPVEAPAPKAPKPAKKAPAKKAPAKKAATKRVYKTRAMKAAP